MKCVLSKVCNATQTCVFHLDVNIDENACYKSRKAIECSGLNSGCSSQVVLHWDTWALSRQLWCERAIIIYHFHVSGLQKATLAYHLAEGRGAAHPGTTHSHVVYHAKWLEKAWLKQKFRIYHYLLTFPAA